MRDIHNNKRTKSMGRELGKHMTHTRFTPPNHWSLTKVEGCTSLPYDGKN